MDPENWQEMSWNPTCKETFSAKLDAEITETHATLEKITGQIAKAQSSISGFSLTELSPTVSKVTLTIQIKDGKHLQKIINALRAIPAVRLVSRHLEKDLAMKPVDVEEEE